jgi:hypothetical protein
MSWFLFDGGVDWLVEAHLRDVFECWILRTFSYGGGRGIWVEVCLGGGGMMGSYGGGSCGCQLLLTLLGGISGLFLSLEHHGRQMLG